MQAADTESTNRAFIFRALIISIFAAALYSNSLLNGFLWDDQFVVVTNQFIESWANLPKFFSQEYLSTTKNLLDTDFIGFFGSGELTYRPTVTLSYMIDCTFWGKNPMGYHLGNVIYHGLAVMALIYFVQTMFQRQMLSYVCGILFAVHPLTSETVNAISFREDIICLIFMLLSMTYFVKAIRAESSQKKNIILCSIFTFLMCLSKEVGAVMPALLFLIYWFQSGNSPIKDRNLFILPCAAVLVYLIIYFGFMYIEPVKPVDWYRENVDIHRASMIRVYGIYITLLLFPIFICVDHYIDSPVTPYDAQSLLTIFALLQLFILAAYCFFQRWKWGLGIFWIILCLLPVAGFFPIRYVVAERYLYMPTAALCIMLAWLLCHINNSAKTKFPILKDKLLVIIILFIGLPGAVAIVNRNADWRDEESLFKATLETNPKSYFANYGLGNIHKDRGEPKKAIPYYEAAIDHNPNYSQPRNNIGLCYMDLEEFDKALEHFYYVAKYSATNYLVHNNISNILIYRKDYKQARVHLEHALKLNPHFAVAYFNLARLNYFEERTADAIASLERAVQLNPGYQKARELLAHLKSKSTKP